MNEFHDWWFSPTLGSKHPFFFNYKATWTTHGICQPSALEEPFWSLFWKRGFGRLRFCDRHGPWKDWYGPWKGRRHGERKRRWEPRGETSTANERLRFVELLKGVLFMQLFVCPPELWPAGCVRLERWVSWGSSLCLPFVFSSFVSECRLCLLALSPWKVPSLFCCSIFRNLFFCSDCRCPSSIEELYIAWRIIPSSKWLGSDDHPHL